VVTFTPRPFYTRSPVIEGGYESHTACIEELANSSYSNRESKPDSHCLIEVSLHSFVNVFLCFHENLSTNMRQRSEKLSRNLLRMRKVQCEQIFHTLFPCVKVMQKDKIQHLNIHSFRYTYQSTESIQK
jgi:hypothetical protein